MHSTCSNSATEACQLSRADRCLCRPLQRSTFPFGQIRPPPILFRSGSCDPKGGRGTRPSTGGGGGEGAVTRPEVGRAAGERDGGDQVASSSRQDDIVHGRFCGHQPLIILLNNPTGLRLIVKDVTISEYATPGLQTRVDVGAPSKTRSPACPITGDADDKTFTCCLRKGIRLGRESV